MRQPLHLRIAAIALAVMIVTLAAVALLTFQLIQVGGRQDVDAVLGRELADIRAGLPAELEAAAGARDGLGADVAVPRYLAAHPGSDRHLTIITVRGRAFSTRDGPAEVSALRAAGTLPSGEPEAFVTVDTDRGPLRLLRTPLRHQNPVIGDIGDVTVIGSLAPSRDAANSALVRIALAGTAGLVAGGLLLVLAVRRALRPVRALADGARSVGSSDLDARVPEPDRLDEVGLLAHEFNRMLERISAADHQRRGLLSALSHELRTPLAVARGHLEIFEQLGPAEGDSAQTTAGVVRHELDRLGRIVDDLTAVSAGELSGATVREPVFIPDVLTALQMRLEGLGIRDVTLAPAPPVVVLGDEDRLAQALLNLVVNARTHTPAGTTVTVTARKVTDAVHLEVSDDGPGIDPDVLPHVFEPFVTTRAGGSDRSSGLGLTVVKAVTEAQGGTVALETGTAGTSVVLTLPSM